MRAAAQLRSSSLWLLLSGLEEARCTALGTLPPCQKRQHSRASRDLNESRDEKFIDCTSQSLANHHRHTLCAAVQSSVDQVSKKAPDRLHNVDVARSILQQLAVRKLCQHLETEAQHRIVLPEQELLQLCKSHSVGRDDAEVARVIVLFFRLQSCLQMPHLEYLLMQLSAVSKWLRSGS
jgi:hypothetical protein